VITAEIPRSGHPGRTERATGEDWTRPAVPCRTSVLLGSATPSTQPVAARS